LNHTAEYAKKRPMKALMSDPVVLICGGIIVFGFVGLILAIRSLFGAGKPPAGAPDDFADAVKNLRDPG
jgi:hypothetical protein